MDGLINYGKAIIAEAGGDREAGKGAQWLAVGALGTLAVRHLLKNEAVNPAARWAGTFLTVKLVGALITHHVKELKPDHDPKSMTDLGVALVKSAILVGAGCLVSAYLPYVGNEPLKQNNYRLILSVLGLNAVNQLLTSAKGPNTGGLGSYVMV